MVCGNDGGRAGTTGDRHGVPCSRNDEGDIVYIVAWMKRLPNSIDNNMQHDVSTEHVV